MQRVQALSRVITRLNPKNVRLNGKRSYGEVLSEREGAVSVKGTINDLPVPSGSWKEYHQKRQTVYNSLLAGSVVFFAIACFACEKGGVFFLNVAPDYKSIVVDTRSEIEDFKQE